jgi:hypothetical protein
MNKGVILRKSYEKAKKRGYNIKWWDLLEALTAPTIVTFDTTRVFKGIELGRHKTRQTNWFSYYDLILDPDFAKAFWSEEWICKHCGERAEYRSLYDEEGVDGTHCDNCDITEVEDCNDDFLKSWQYHLQQMVLEPEPLKYLEEFLED